MKIINRKKETNIVRITLDVPYDIYKRMKEINIIKNCNMRTYILQAIIQQIAHDTVD